MGDNSNKKEDNNSFKDFEKSATQGATGKAIDWSGEKISKEISRSYQNKEISFWAKEQATAVPKGLSFAGKAFEGLSLAENINADYKKTHSMGFAVTKNLTSFGLGKAAELGTIIGLEESTLGVGGPVAVATGIYADAAVSTGVNIAFDKAYSGYQKSKKWIKYYENIKKQNELAKFKKLEPANLGTSNQPVAGVANNTGIVDNTQVQVTYTQPVVSENPLGWMAQVGSILSGIASVISSGVSLLGGSGGVPTVTTPQVPNYWTETNAQIYKGPTIKSKHTGGIVVPKYKGGRNEMMAILQGGETVRTEAQEKELQDAKTKELLDAYAPLVSGENNENDPYAQVFGNNKSNKKDSKTPVLANKTKHDEEMIIAIIADAWKSNRSGFRSALRYN